MHSINQYSHLQPRHLEELENFGSALNFTTSHSDTQPPSLFPIGPEKDLGSSSHPPN